MFHDGLFTEEDAKQHKLVQLTEWLTVFEKGWLERECRRIGGNPERTAMIVKKDVEYALFVNDMTECRICEC